MVWSMWGDKDTHTKFGVSMSRHCRNTFILASSTMSFTKMVRDIKKLLITFLSAWSVEDLCEIWLSLYKRCRMRKFDILGF